MKIIATIEARMGSSRLPGKVFKEINRKPMIYYLVERLKRVKEIDEIVLATTKNIEDNVLENFAKESKISIFRGEENNVLKRVYDASFHHKANVVIQLTGDNPIIDIEILKKCLKIFKKRAPDSLNTIFSNSFPVGMFINILSFEALQKSHEQATGIYREHVGLFIRDNLNLFDTLIIHAEPRMNRPDIVITVDEIDDFNLVKKIFLHFKNREIKFSCIDLIDFFDQNPQLLSINKSVKRRF